ncbi:MAG: response regulator [Gaiellales bacterium]|nr:MAG: response regulator [Gaiellales bacterium]
MTPEMVRDAKILAVDDEPANVRLLEEILKREGYARIKSIMDPRQVLPQFATFQPDLILLDLMMPHLDGFAVMRQLIPRIPTGAYLPILVLTADSTLAAKQQALSFGAKDFLTKPFDRAEVVLRVKNLLETRYLHLALQDQNQKLDVKVQERTRELEVARLEVLERLALAAEYRDDVTGQHTRRVGAISAILARALGHSDDEIELIRRAAPMHDIGKIGISDAILLKPGKLTPEEFEVMKSHTMIGAKIQSGSVSPLLQMAEVIALTHHEKWDGTGYLGLSGDAIPQEGRIVAVADVFDALTNIRPYKPAFAPEEALRIIRDGSGAHFDPEIVARFLSSADDILDVQRQVQHLSDRHLSLNLSGS